MNIRLLFFFLLFCTQVAIAQHNFVRYSLQEGLPQSQVYAISEDLDGYLWVGTQGGGIAQFDGLQFKSNLNLPDNYINALKVDNQRMWIGTNSMLICYSADSTQIVHWPNQHTRKVTALAIDNHGLLWVGTEKGLYYLNTQKIPFQLHKYKKLKNAFVRSFFFRDNEQWVATNTGAWALHIDQRFSIRNGLESNDIHALFRDVLGRLWIASFGGRITLFDTENNSFITALKIPNNGHPQFIRQVENEIWIGTLNNGIESFNIDTKKWSAINDKNGLASKNIKTIFKDSWDNLWLGTSGEGLLQSVGQEFIQYGISTGLKGDNIYAVYNDRQDRLIFSESGYGFSILEKGQIKHFGQHEGFLDVKCKALVEDTKGRIWIGTEGHGLAYQDTSGFHFLTEKDGLPSNWINSLVLDSLGHIWASTYGNGLVKIIDKDTLGFQLFPYGKAEGLPNTQITSLKIGPNKKLWFTTRMGQVGYFSADFQTKIFFTQHGLPTVAVRTIAFDKYDNIWVGTAGKGIYVADNNQPIQFKKLQTTNPKSSANIYLLGFGQDGQLWAGTETGLDLYDLVRNRIKNYKHFGKAEGFLGIETCQNAFVKDQENNIWFGTMNGLMKYRKNFETKAIAPPKIRLADIQLFYKSVSDTPFNKWLGPTGLFKQGLILPHDQNHLGFRVRATNLARPKQIKYRWQLAGSETEWSPLSTTHTINYANLAPGQYVFKAQACITLDNCSTVITTAFGIQQPYWQTWWFKLAIASGLLLLIFTLYKIRMNAVRKKQRATLKELELQNHLLKVEQKALQLQMNPHFIFNALNSINGLVALKDFAQARRQINRFAVLMRQILSNSRKDFISLEEEVKTLENYLSMEQFCRPDIFNFQIDVEDNIDIEEIEVPPMIIQPFVENAIIHGVSHLDEQGQINIHFSRKGEVLLCEITDNGVGREKSAQLRQNNNPSHQSTAMAVTEERLSALFGEHRGEALVISNIVHDTGTIAGTKVLLRIPIKH